MFVMEFLILFIKIGISRLVCSKMLIKYKRKRLFCQLKKSGEKALQKDHLHLALTYSVLKNSTKR